MEQASITVKLHQPPIPADSGRPATVANRSCDQAVSAAMTDAVSKKHSRAHFPLFAPYKQTSVAKLRSAIMNRSGTHTNHVTLLHFALIIGLTRGRRHCGWFGVTVSTATPAEEAARMLSIKVKLIAPVTASPWSF